MTPAALKALLDGDMENAIAASTPGGIEAMEKDGQTKLVRHADRLPVDGTISGRIDGVDRRKQWEDAGFVFGEVLPGKDAIFVACTFPKGWSMAPTEHSMWSDVVDDKGRKRAAVFFKAAFYDYKAHTSGLKPRYRAGELTLANGSVSLGIVDDAKRAMVDTLKEWPSEKDYYGDGDYAGRDALRDEARAKLAGMFPDCGNPLAYWE